MLFGKGPDLSNRGTLVRSRPSRSGWTCSRFRLKVSREASMPDV
jgi:hypothetical protein